jgi:zinc and cadmium transporter
LIWPVALLLAIAGSAGGLLVAWLLFARRRAGSRLVSSLVSYAVGALLGVSLLNLMPQALEALEPGRALGALLAGILMFFVLEKFVLWRHAHDHDEGSDQGQTPRREVHPATATLVIVGDALHTFTDGVVIAAATLVSVPFGATTALAIIAHEIPQEAGDFAILLAAGHTPRRALLLNLTSALGGVAGAGVMLFVGSGMPDILPYVLAFAAGNFLYVAMADLIPALHRGMTDRGSFWQLALIGLGLTTILVL